MSSHIITSLPGLTRERAEHWDPQTVVTLAFDALLDRIAAGGLKSYERYDVVPA